jgi:PHD/YefM family antitoxin component YafN of YafNO toxin-antitoxin module
MHDEEPSFSLMSIDQVTAGFARLHRRVCCDRGRVEIRDGDRTCVLISKEELDALEEALEILSNTADVQKMARTIAALTHTVATKEPVGACAGGGAN